MKKNIVNEILKTRTEHTRNLKRTIVMAHQLNDKDMIQDVASQLYSLKHKSLSKSSLSKMTNKQLKGVRAKIGVNAGTLKKQVYMRNGVLQSRYVKTGLKGKDLTTYTKNKAIIDAKMGKDEFEEALERYLEAKRKYEQGEISKEEFNEERQRFQNHAIRQSRGIQRISNKNNKSTFALDMKTSKMGLDDLVLKVPKNTNTTQISRLKIDDVSRLAYESARNGGVDFKDAGLLGRSTIEYIKNSPINKNQIIDLEIKRQSERYLAATTKQRMDMVKVLKSVKKGLVDRTVKSPKDKWAQNIVNGILKVVRNSF